MQKIKLIIIRLYAQVNSIVIKQTERQGKEKNNIILIYPDGSLYKFNP